MMIWIYFFHFIQVEIIEKYIKIRGRSCFISIFRSPKTHEGHVLHGSALREPLSSPLSASDAVGQSLAQRPAGWIGRWVPAGRGSNGSVEWWWYDVQRSLSCHGLPWPAMACHGLPWPAMAYDVGFLPPFFFNKHGQTQKKCCFRGKLTGKHSFVAKKLNLCVLFSLKLDETCLKLHHGISMVYLYKSPDASPKAGVPQSTRSQRSCSTSRWKGWRNSSFRLPTAPQTLPHRKSLGGYQETYETYADFQTLTFVEDER